jgi:hypothetical protein
MFDSWQKIEITEKDTAVVEAGRKLLVMTEKYIASDGGVKEANELSDQAGNFVVELLMAAANKRVHWTLRLWAWLKDFIRSGLRQ